MSRRRGSASEMPSDALTSSLQPRVNSMATLQLADKIAAFVNMNLPRRF
jgi:hypothetical protein